MYIDLAPRFHCGTRVLLAYNYICMQIPSMHKVETIVLGYIMAIVNY